GDLEQPRDAARAHQVDHDDVDRALLQHVAEGHRAVDVFAAGDRRGEGGGDPREAFVVVVRGHVLQPVQPHVLYPAADVDRLVHAPDLIDVAHEIGVVADRL